MFLKKCLLVRPQQTIRPLQRPFSHGPTMGEVYASYQKIDEVLRKVRPDLVADPEKLREMQANGDITPTMAEHFIKEAKVMKEAKSMYHPQMNP